MNEADTCHKLVVLKLEKTPPTPEQLLESITAKEQRVLEIVQEIRTLLGRPSS